MKNETTTRTNAAGHEVRCASLFSQILSLIDRSEFAAAVQRTGAEKRTKGFSCWDQFVAMCFCQLAQAKSLREIGEGLACCEGRLRHLGIEESPARSTLSDANCARPASLFEEIFYSFLGRCRAAAPGHGFRFKSKLLSLDSTVIELCASMFDGARFRRTKGAAKLHLLLDHDGCLQFKSRRTWALSHLIALLRWNLFSYRDLWAWLERPLQTPPQLPPETQLALCLG